MAARRSARRTSVPRGRLLPKAVERAFTRAVQDLAATEARAAVVGGLAVGARASPRVTRDVDFAISVGADAEAERLIRALMGRGWRVEATLEHDSGRLATVRLSFPAFAGVLVDLLFYFAGIEPEIVSHATEIDLLGTTARVATLPQLLAMKVIAARDKDLADVGLLLEVASRQDLVSAERLLRLASARGFEDGRDLVRELRALARRQRRTSVRFRPSSRFKRS